MATESVTSQSDPVSWWGPLLKHMPQRIDEDGRLACDLSADELKEIESSAGEVIRIIIDGFSAIGELQWRASAHDNGSIDADVFGLLGPLQTQLAELLAALRVTEANAVYWQRELEAQEPKEAKAA